MTNKRETLTRKEQAAQDVFLAKLDIRKRKTKKPIIVAFLGLVGSGKSSVAKEIARPIGATVIEEDRVRLELRKRKESYEKSRLIAENVALEILKEGGNVVLDSDFTYEKKRQDIRKLARRAGARLVFIRVHCEPDVMLGRMLSARYRNHPDDFFGGASSLWQGSRQLNGAIVKVREMWRRTAHHYRWVNQGGGQWKLKKFPFATFAEINTTNQDSWKREVNRVTKRLLAL